jgi:hypothetical protein
MLHVPRSCAVCCAVLCCAGGMVRFSSCCKDMQRCPATVVTATAGRLVVTTSTRTQQCQQGPCLCRCIQLGRQDTRRACAVQCSLACSIRLAFLGIQPTTIPVALPWGVVGINGPTCAGIVCMCSLTVTEIIPGFQQLSSLTQQLGPVETNGLKHMHATVSFTHMTL